MITAQMGLEACWRGCTLTGQHNTDCAGDECKGCLPRPTDTGHLCARCYVRLQAALAAAPGIIDALRYIGQPYASAAPTDQAHGNGDPAETVPLHQAWLDVDELEHHLASWALLVSEELGHSATIPDPIGYLLTHLDYLAGHQLAPEVTDELTTAVFGLRARWEAADDRPPKPVPVREPCPRCAMFTLATPTHDRYYIGCDNPDCAAVWSQDEWDRLHPATPKGDSLRTDDGEGRIKA